MVFKEDRVLCILTNGQVLREVNGEVFLPFGTEYVVRVKNYTSKRCGITIKIDGSYIHPDSTKIIVNANDTIDIERMMVDGDLNKGPRLKFVSVNDPRVSDPGNHKNGLVEVTFYDEIEPITYVPYTYSNPWWTPGPFGDNEFLRGKPIITCDTSYSCNVNCNSLQDGATIAGSTSEQKFRCTNVNLSSIPSLKLQLRLKGIKEDRPIFVKDTRSKYCSQCGKKCRFRDKFCSRCGAKLV